jgi:FtsZ-binding cell division protein ZapB
MDNNNLLENATREVFEWAKKYGELKAQYDALEQGSIRKNQALQDRNDELEQWKREATLVLNPILDYGQKHPDIKLGQSISTFVVDRCKQYDELKAENEALKVIRDSSQENYDELLREHAALKEKADKMRDCLDAVLIIHSAFPLHDSELIEDINDALSTYSNKLSQERADLIREVNNRDLGENKVDQP